MPNLSTSRQNPSLVSLGGEIRRLRMERCLSQETLALLAEVDRSYLGRVERGDNNAAVLTLVKIAKALGTTLAALSAGAGL